MVYIFYCLYSSLDDYDYGDDMICMWCDIEREKLYMGGGLWVYKCPKCGSRMETNKE